MKVFITLELLYLSQALRKVCTKKFIFLILNQNILCRY